MAKAPEIVDLPLGDAFVIKPSHFNDLRGDFCKIFTQELLAQKGVKPFFAEQFISTSQKGVVRGLHYLKGESSQAKLVWCPRGEIFDVIVDLRQSSPTFGRWAGLTLSESNLHALYVPHGFAHGFMSLCDHQMTVYQADAPYVPDKDCGLIYNDKTLGIKWPSLPVILSEKDGRWPSFKDCEKFD